MNKNRDRLRIAIQKSGRLSEVSLGLLAQCGLTFKQSRDKLFCFGETMPVDLLLVRDDDIPGLLAQSVCDLGMVGRNVLSEAVLAAGEQAPALKELRPLGFGGCRLSVAVPQDEEWIGPAQLAGRRIATSYPALLQNYLNQEKVDATIVTLSGSVEIAPRLGTAEVICDLVSSGATLVANQLKEAVSILQSEAILAGSAEELVDSRRDLLAMLLRRLDGVLAVRDTKLVLLNTKRASLAGIKKIFPELTRFTVTAMDGSDDDISVQALCFGAITWQHLEDTRAVGAENLLVVPVERMLS